MDIKNQVAFWACIIISTVYSTADKPVWALVWIAFAILYAFFDYVANKEDDTDKYA